MIDYQFKGQKGIMNFTDEGLQGKQQRGVGGR